MNILLITNDWLPKKGGITTYLSKLSENLNSDLIVYGPKWADGENVIKSKAKFISWFHADMQLNPSIIPKIYKKFKYDLNNKKGDLYVHITTEYPSMNKLENNEKTLLKSYYKMSNI